MVEDRRHLMNAIALNSTIFNLARVVGPAVGGIILAALGAAWCFGLNGLSFVVGTVLFQVRRLAGIGLPGAIPTTAWSGGVESCENMAAAQSTLSFVMQPPM